MEIRGYRIRGELKTTNSGFSRWGYADKDGSAYFIKEFIDPIYPTCTEFLTPEMIEHKKRLCRQFEDRTLLLYREINRCSDGNLVSIKDFFREGSHYYLVMEKVAAVSMRLVKNLPTEDRIRICKALLHSIGGMHQSGLVHGDIKLDNLMFRELSSGKITVKVIDFDNSFWEREPPNPQDEIQGDPVYMAPETFRMMAEEEGVLTRAIDVFALGLVFHQIFAGDLPGFNRSMYDYVFEAVLAGERLDYSDKIPIVWKNIIEGMTEKEPEQRLSIEEAEQSWRLAEGKLCSTFTNRRISESAESSFFEEAGDLPFGDSIIRNRLKESGVWEMN